MDEVLCRPFLRELCELAQQAGYGVERNDHALHPLGGGVSIHSERVIRISTRLRDLDAFAVLTHEVGHVLLNEGSVWFPQSDSPTREREADEAAYLVLNHYGYGGAHQFVEPPSRDTVSPRVAAVVERILAALPSGGFYG